MTGVLGLLAGGGDHDADHDVDHDVDADADHDADHDVDGDADHEPGIGDKILVDLGVGRVPFSILWQTFAVAFGLTGLALNTLYFGRSGVLVTSSLAYSLPASLLVAYLVTRFASRLLGRVVAAPGGEGTSRKHLVGQVGVVISSRVTDEFGEIRAKDPAGHFVHLICRVREGEAPIPTGREVVIVDYDSTEGRIFVAPLDEEPPPPLRVAGGGASAESEAEADAAEIERTSSARIDR